MATLLGSTIAQVHSQQEACDKIARAHDFFKLPVSAAALAVSAPATGASPAPDSSIATDQGAVQFHLIGQKPDDPKYSAIMQENADNLLAMGGLVHGYMLRNYPTVTADSIDINTWLNVVSHLPAITPPDKKNKTYKNRIVGVRVSGEFLSMIAKAIITDGASLLADFTSYLNSIGDVTLSASNRSESYTVLTCTYLMYMVSDGVGGYYDYSAISLKQIKFNEYFQELKSSCISEQYVNIDLAYDEYTFLVQSRQIRQGGQLYQGFQGLVNPNATAQLQAANNFFNAPSVPQKEISPQV
ncbi:MAG: hypothetical protein AB7N91_15170 [Candidatus Tectimicrobiota bacterium]